MNIERRYLTSTELPVKLETRDDGKTQRITGYGAVTYAGTPDTEYVLWDYKSERAVERIAPGAFAKALERQDDVRALFNHDPSQLLGRSIANTLKLSVDGRGLAYEITPGNTTVARDVLEHLARGDVSGSSFAFRAEEERWTETKDADGKWNVVRDILSVRLYDVGPVTYPAYTGTSANVRSAGDAESAKESLAAFRAANPAADFVPDFSQRILTFRETVIV